MGLAASVIAVATLAYTSTKALYSTINEIHKAPKTLQQLGADLDVLHTLLESLSAEIKGKTDVQLSDGIRECLKETKPPLEGCAKACDEFKTKLSKITSNSTDKHIALVDKVKLQFEEKEISAFRYRLGSYKATLNIALSFASLKTTSKNNEELKGLETTIDRAVSGITGQIQGMQIGMQAIADFGAEKDDFKQALDEQNAALGQCLKVCMAALSSANKTTGKEVKFARAYDEAKQLVGIVGYVPPGGATVSIVEATAHGQAWQAVGVFSEGSAMGFFTSPRPAGEVKKSSDP